MSVEIDNICYCAGIISASGKNFWGGLIDVIKNDVDVDPQTKLALYSIVKQREILTSKSPAKFSQVVKETIEDIFTKGWDEFGFDSSLLPTLTDEYREQYILTPFITYILQETGVVVGSLMNFINNPNLLIPPKPSWEYGYGFDEFNNYGYGFGALVGDQFEYFTVLEAIPQE